MNEASLARAARAIASLPRDRRVLAAVDGLDGAGKTTFADLLAPRVDRPVARVRERACTNVTWRYVPGARSDVVGAEDPLRHFRLVGSAAK